MNINPTQSPIPSPYNPLLAKNSTNPSTDSSSSASTSATNSADVDKIKEKVRQLVSQSDVRPEVVAKYKSTDPVKSYSDADLSRLVSALQNEE